MNANNRKENKISKWIAIAFILLATAPELVITAAIIGGLIWLAAKSKSKQESATKALPTRYTTRQQSFDECPQSIFCRHSDKSEHHVRRGKEIDPWDRPDIDISKYQRKR